MTADRGSSNFEPRTSNFENGGLNIKVGIGYDVHALVEKRSLILGGVEIPHERGLLGHSDADVLTHAIMDALLGALSLGDIGGHFPDHDSRYRGISSLTLLGHVMGLVKSQGYRVGNLDSIIMAERPKLAPYISKMRFNLSQVLNVEEACVSVKATTTERLGFVGREEGIGAQAIVSLKRLED
ncbi:2-C-methyl-D-erythritol 2,4-cyclodiphosphate synthase [Desulfosporosinus sp.]|uniref:2-C-methyl-D-erythritol 2,4-cyclodiphosphate synthase n=1 Tax=Desulfosporosinus sp. TaxID=157907 RepID=UPI000E8DA056|nr:2-C-methyl-D-erythritol 2,4-cyclodiphosphate synthase [Desulfosporosinus sp.]MBC2721309.1 2-C-methyl-D-erythritol 2,4-cyclodiphosphate synthase [Desulfosporosinus sp.]MBC2728741.1 2-C-methyl-D-erythritol 2,4-cyclodiphosphate synthase [Desulfosporosinus sp.]HBV87693.1 2-C-methyl-D-erythritol 2,4-cyclodiphosphate synthase [Desulfosporosinus sp.]